MKKILLIKFAILIAILTQQCLIFTKVNYILESIQGDQATVIEHQGDLKTQDNTVTNKFQGTIINTKNNNVKINKDVCAIFSINKEEIIICESGKVFENICTKTKAATATPTWADQDDPNRKNYIGYRPADSIIGNDKIIVYYLCDLHAN